LGRSSGNRIRVSSRGRNGIKRLSSRNAGCRRKHLVRLRGTLAKMRFVGKKVAAEDICSTWGAIARVFLEDVVFVAAMHAARKPERVFVLEISSWVDWNFGWRSLRRMLVPVHGLFRWRHKRASRVWIIRGRRVRDGGR
jgi:hypothetical protein